MIFGDQPRRVGKELHLLRQAAAFDRVLPDDLPFPIIRPAGLPDDGLPVLAALADVVHPAGPFQRFQAGRRQTRVRGRFAARSG